MVFFFKQKTAYEMRISDWSSDVCSSDLRSGWAGGILKQRLVPLPCRIMHGNRLRRRAQATKPVMVVQRVHGFQVQKVRPHLGALQRKAHHRVAHAIAMRHRPAIGPKPHRSALRTQRAPRPEERCERKECGTTWSTGWALNNKKTK